MVSGLELTCDSSSPSQTLDLKPDADTDRMPRANPGGPDFSGDIDGSDRGTIFGFASRGARVGRRSHRGRRQRTHACAGVIIKIVSAFRSVDRQAEIIRAKLAEGLSLDAVLCVSAPPGYSEHHSGRAIDVTTDEGAAPLEPEFEKTRAFRWLSKNAGQFGFALSFPADNPYGYDYEPWHWCFRV